jgi:transcriptional regulator with XRE-family HTH domain
MSKPKSKTAEYIRVEMEHSTLTQKEVSEFVGFKTPNLVTMIKQGSTKLPVDKIPKFAKILEIDPVRLFKMAFMEYDEPGYNAIVEVMGEPVTKTEREVLKLLERIAPSNDIESPMEIKGYLEKIEAALTNTSSEDLYRTIK